MCEFLILNTQKGTKSRKILATFRQLFGNSATFRQLFEKNSNFLATFRHFYRQLFWDSSENLQREYRGSLNSFSFSLFPPQKRTKQNKRQVYRNTQKQCGEEAQKETIRLRSFPFCSFSVEQVSWFWVGRWGEKKNHKKSENRRPETPASLPWSLKTTRPGHQMDTNSIWRKI